MMNKMDQIKRCLPQTGEVTWLSRRPVRRGDVEPVSEISVTTTDAIEGDHYSRGPGKRMVTLIQGEHIDAIAGILGKEIQPELLRRNIIVRGINLLSLHETRFQIGESLILEGTGFCHPCDRMEENLGPGGYNAMRGHGGLTAKVIADGKVKIGDTVKMIEVIDGK